MDNFSEVKPSDCIKRKLPAGTALSATRTLILQSVINEIKAHGRTSMNREVCGVLVGQLCLDDDQPYLSITARIEGKYAEHQIGSVTFTSETWDYIHQQMAEKYPDQKIVGWYHTHPGFGIFLSNMDMFIHENFFSPRWQPAYVYDPQAESDGFFFWHGENLDPGDITIIPDEKPIASTNKTRTAAQSENKIIITADDEANNTKKQVLIMLLIALVAMLSIFIFVFYWQNRSLREKHQQNQSLREENEQLNSINGQLKNENNQLHIGIKKLNNEIKLLNTDNDQLRRQLIIMYKQKISATRDQGGLSQPPSESHDAGEGSTTLNGDQSK